MQLWLHTSPVVGIRTCAPLTCSESCLDGSMRFRTNLSFGSMRSSLCVRCMFLTALLCEQEMQRAGHWKSWTLWVYKGVKRSFCTSKNGFDGADAADKECNASLTRPLACASHHSTKRPPTLLLCDPYCRSSASDPKRLCAHNRDGLLYLLCLCLLLSICCG